MRPYCVFGRYFNPDPADSLQALPSQINRLVVFDRVLHGTKGTGCNQDSRNGRTGGRAIENPVYVPTTEVGPTDDVKPLQLSASGVGGCEGSGGVRASLPSAAV